MNLVCTLTGPRGRFQHKHFFYLTWEKRFVRSHVLHCHLLIHAEIHIYILDKYWHNDKRRIKDARRKTQEDFFTIIFTSHFICKSSKGLHVRGCRRPNANFIFWPHCYDRHVVSLLFSWCWGLLHRGFPRAPSVGCGLPYHISSLTLWESAGNCIGGFRGPPRSGVTFLTTSGLYCLEVCWQLHRGFSECPLGRVWPSLPHLVSNPLGVCWQLLWDPNSTELNNNSTPTRSPTGSLQSNV